MRRADPNLGQDSPLPAPPASALLILLPPQHQAYMLQVKGGCPVSCGLHHYTTLQLSRETGVGFGCLFAAAAVKHPAPRAAGVELRTEA